MSGERVNSIALTGNCRPVAGAMREQLEAAGLGITNSGKPVCPRFALPPMAYQAFEELRRNTGAPDEEIIGKLLAVMTAAAQTWIRILSPHKDEPEIVSQSFYICTPLGTGSPELTGKLLKSFRECGLERLKKKQEAEKDRKDKYALLKAKRRGLLNRVTRLYARNVNADIEETEIALANLSDVLPPIGSAFMMKSAISVVKLLAELEGTNVPAFWTSSHGHQFFGRMTSDEMEYMAQLYDGATLNYETLHHSGVVDQALLTTCVITPSGVLEKFVKKKGDACLDFLAKGLLCRAVPGDQNHYSAIMNPLWSSLNAFNAKSTNLIEGYYEGIANSTFSPLVLEFDSQAKQRFMEKMEESRRKTASQDHWGGIEKFANNYPSHVARMAAVFHFFGEKPGTLITVETLMNAINIADWYMEEAKHILVTEPQDKAISRLVTFLHRKCFIERRHENYTDKGCLDFIPIRFIMNFHNIDKEPLLTLLRPLQGRGLVDFVWSWSGKECIHLNAASFSRL